MYWISRYKMDEEQLLDYEEEQEELNVQKNDAVTNGDATKKIKV